MYIFSIWLLILLVEEKRELKERNGSFKINNIWSGRQGDSYPGDRYILMEDFICIQIHKIQLKVRLIADGQKKNYLHLEYTTLKNFQNPFFQLLINKWS